MGELFHGQMGALTPNVCRHWTSRTPPAQYPRLGHRRMAGSRPRACTPFKVNAVWPCDFNFLLDTTAKGQQIKEMTVIDEYNR